MRRDLANQLVVAIAVIIIILALIFAFTQGAA
jgi:hypothetical protein